MTALPPTEALSKNFLLGDPVEFGRYLERRIVAPRSRRVWTPTIVHMLQQHKHSDHWVDRLRGVIIGTRTLANGHVEWDEGSLFIPDQRVRAYLVAYELHRSPVHVLPEDLVFT